MKYGRDQYNRLEALKRDFENKLQDFEGERNEYKRYAVIR